MEGILAFLHCGREGAPHDGGSPSWRRGSVTSQIAQDHKSRMGGFLDRPLGENSVNHNSLINVAPYIYKFCENSHTLNSS